MKIAFVWDWENELDYVVGWKDGLAAAVREIEREHEVRIFTQIRGLLAPAILPHEYFNIYAYPDVDPMVEGVRQWGPEKILAWGDLTRPALPDLTKEFPTSLCFSGGPTNYAIATDFEDIFVENDVYKERFALDGIEATIAFGINEDIFYPREKPQVWHAFFPATFARWKRHDLFAAATLKMDSMVCGWKQEQEPECWQVCEQNNVTVLGHATHELVAEFYNMSQCVIVTSSAAGGSQRTVLEAFASNVPCIVMSDSDKCSELAFQVGAPELIVEPDPQVIFEKYMEINQWGPQDYRPAVLEQYSYKKYAETILSRLCE